jgi:hypothetical protein
MRMQGVIMMTEREAEIVKRHAVNAIEQLSTILQSLRHLESGEFETLKGGIGRSIGFIDENILYPIYTQYPKLSDVD